MQQIPEVNPTTLSVSVIRLLLDVMRNDVIHGDRCCRLIGDELVRVYESQLREWIITCHQRRNNNDNVNTADDHAKEQTVYTIYVMENEVANAINSYCIRHFLLSAPQLLLLVSEGGIALSLRLLAQRIREEGNVEFIHAAHGIEEEVEHLTQALDTHKYAHLIDLLGEIVILYMLRAHVVASQLNFNGATNYYGNSVNQLLRTNNVHDAHLDKSEEYEKEKQKEQRRLSEFLIHSIQSTVYQFASEAVKERKRIEEVRQQSLNTQADHVLFNVHTPAPASPLEREQHNSNETNNNNINNNKSGKENIKHSSHIHPEPSKRKRTLHQLPRSSTDFKTMENALHNDSMLNVSNNNHNNSNTNNNNNMNGNTDHETNNANTRNNNADNQKDVNSNVVMSSFASSLPTIDESDVNMNSATEINVNGQASQHVKHLYVPANDSHENLSFGEDKTNSSNISSTNKEVVDNVHQFELDETGTRYVLVNTARAVVTAYAIKEEIANDYKKVK